MRVKVCFTVHLSVGGSRSAVLIVDICCLRASYGVPDTCFQALLWSFVQLLYRVFYARWEAGNFASAFRGGSVGSYCGGYGVYLARSWCVEGFTARLEGGVEPVAPASWVDTHGRYAVTLPMIAQFYCWLV